MAVPTDDAYQNTVERLEPSIHMIDNGAAAASIAISLKRIADAFEKILAMADADKRESDRIKNQYKTRD